MEANLGRISYIQKLIDKRIVDEDSICGGLTNYDSMLKYQKIGEMDSKYPFLSCSKSDFWME